MKRFLISILLSMLCVTSHAQIIGQSVYPEHVNFVLDCKPEGQEQYSYISKKWTFSPPTVSAISLPDNALVVTGAPGKYTATCKLIVGEKTDAGVLIKNPDTDIVEFTHSFTILDSGNQPKPIPPDEDEEKPVPPTPPVVVEGAWVILVEQTQDRLNHQDWLLIQQNTSLWESLSKKGLKWRWYDYDSSDALMYTKDADKAGLPAILIYDKSGNLLAKEDADNIKTKEQFNELIKRSTGK